MCPSAPMTPYFRVLTHSWYLPVPQSGELLGVIFGVLLNILLPELLIIVFLAVLLSYNALRTLRKGLAKYKAETEAMKKAEKAAEKPTSITVHGKLLLASLLRAPGQRGTPRMPDN